MKPKGPYILFQGFPSACHCRDRTKGMICPLAEGCSFSQCSRWLVPESLLPTVWGLQLPMFCPCLQVVVLCFAVAFGGFFQGYGPYPSATKMALPSQHRLSEPYTASVGKSTACSVCLQLAFPAFCKESRTKAQCVNAERLCSQVGCSGSGHWTPLCSTRKA